ncbi:MAG: M20 family metallopeptidase [Intestinimonas sp.]|jgi:amidohydrolase|nr:M20 family metallopeptidase [Intestinimonas sp.]
MDNILAQGELIGEQIAGWRRNLHQIPERDLNLPLTRSYVCHALDELGIKYSLSDAHSGIVALVRGAMMPADAKTVALRADMDALPIRERADVPYASKNGAMHACGHDAHMAMLLGAAKLLMQNRDRLFGQVKLIFQPGEELSGGALRMVEEGALHDPDVDVVFGQHAGLMSSELPGGHFGFYPGAFMASRDSFVITVHGKSCHGAQPASGVDPVVIAAQIVMALQTLISREISGTDTAVLTIGAIHGGETYNIIPETVQMRGAIRCLDESQRQYLKDRIRQVCHGICETMRAACTIEYEDGFPVTVNDPDATRFAMDCAKRLLGEARVHRLRKPLMTSEDMAIFLSRRPGSYWIFSTPPEKLKPYPNHSPYFTIDDTILYQGAALLAEVTLEWLAQNRS